jgi:hypothetical protein
VREHLVSWLRAHQPGALPQMRVRDLPRGQAVTRQEASGSDQRVFGESEDGQERVQAFSGPPTTPTTSPAHTSNGTPSDHHAT